MWVTAAWVIVRPPGSVSTAAGYLPLAVVEHLAARTGIAGWWIGSANREDLTRPVARLRSSARALGLIGVRKGRVTPTALARRSRHEPVALWQHIVSRLPVGRTDFDREAAPCFSDSGGAWRTVRCSLLSLSTAPPSRCWGFLPGGPVVGG